jgi:hypothetical protein
MWNCYNIWFYFENFKEPSYCFPQWLYCCTYSPKVHQNSNLPICSSTLIIFVFLFWYTYLVDEKWDLITNLLAICTSSLEGLFFRLPQDYSYRGSWYSVLPGQQKKNYSHTPIAFQNVWRKTTDIFHMVWFGGNGDTLTDQHSPALPITTTTTTIYLVQQQQQKNMTPIAEVCGQMLSLISVECGHWCPLWV